MSDLQKQLMIVGGIVVAIVIVFGVWLGGGSGNSSSTSSSDSGSNSNDGNVSPADEPAGDALSVEDPGVRSAVRDLVTYQVPDGWREETCETEPAVIYMVPADLTLDCGAARPAPMSIALDPSRTVSCAQTSGKPGVAKHACEAVTVNGKRGLRASTQYKPDTAAAASIVSDSVYLPAGASNSSVVKFEYRYTGAAAYQQQFQQIAGSIKAAN